MSKTLEQQTPWVGLAYVEEHGLPGYPRCEKPFATHGCTAARVERPQRSQPPSEFSEL